MKAFIKLTITDYLVSWAIAAELCLLLAFLMIARYAGPIRTLPALGMTGLFALLAIPVSVRRLTNRAWSSKSRYLIAANLGRRDYLLGLAIAAFIINSAILLASFSGVWLMNAEIFSFSGTAKSFALLAAMIVFNISLCLILSRLTAPRIGAPASLAIIILLGLADPRPFKAASAKAFIRGIQAYGPHLKLALEGLSKPSMADWPITVLQLAIYAIALLALSAIAFKSKELIFEN
jgi:hypothetical protein